MFEDCSGKLAKSVEEAECYIWKFIAENADCEKHIKEHSLDFDLYLPWLLEILEYQKPADGRKGLPILELQQMYMDAAWDLVMQGYLRPGPRTITGGGSKESYGKGYALTARGRARLEEEAGGKRI